MRAVKSSNSIKVFLCDDQTLFRQGVRKLLESEKDITVVGETSNGVELLEELKKIHPDVILMDIDMPQMDGVAAILEAKKVLSNVNVIILTVHDDEFHIFESIKAGAIGYFLKNVSIKELLEGVRRAYKNEALIQPVIATKVLKEFTMLDKRKIKDGNKFYNGLTAREKQVLRLIALGGANKAIGFKLGIKEKTVKNHITNIFQTLHVNNRTQAALYVLDKKKDENTDYTI